MAEAPQPVSGPTGSPQSSNVPGKAPPKSNPAFRALGLPNFRWRLPSRNWMIFLTITGSWTGALLYDRRQKKEAQRKWCQLVEHIAHEPLPTSSLARRVTIYLAAPPGDGIRSAREHFIEYVKPILVAAAMDWDVVEGRREGEVRAGLAEKIRRFRINDGEVVGKYLEPDGQSALEALRQRTGVQDFHGPRGDIVIGRHTWKEYVRGLHEGWLGPLDALVQAAPSTSSQSDATFADADGNSPIVATSLTSASPPTPNPPTAIEHPAHHHDEEKVSPVDGTGEDDKVSQQPQPPKKPLVTPPYNTTASYDSSPIPSKTPQEFHPSTPIAFPHILGIVNTPIRMYRFLNRRKLADDIGRQTAAAVLAAHRSYDSPSFHSSEDKSKNMQWEQEHVLEGEERMWNGKFLSKGDETMERVWSNPMVIDGRIADRMRRFALTAIDEDRARQIGSGSSGIPGRPID